MKAYEMAARNVLPGRLPVIIRVDGKAFHTYTRGTNRPFDTMLGDVMIHTAKMLCETIQGAQLAYTQSDEISVLVHSYKNFDTSAWFDNQVQKMCSVAASTASAHFTAWSWRIWGDDPSAIKPAVFDARVFVIPEADVCNYFLWRQQDATRNSVQMLARSLYSHKQLDGKNNTELKQLCIEKGRDWFALEPRWQRGVCVRRIINKQYVTDPMETVRWHWTPDYDIPLFNQDRDYVNKLLELEQE